MMSGTGGYQHGLTPQITDSEFWSDVLNFKRGLGSPKAIPNLAAWYDVSDLGSMVYDGSNRVSLLSDKSGNSNSKCLILSPATVNNYATTPDSNALDVTGDIDLRCDMAVENWSLAADQVAFAKWNTSNSYMLVVNTGSIRFYCAVATVTKSALSTVTVPFANYGRGWIRATRASASGDVTFYTSTNGTTWTQLGAVVSTTAGAIDSGTSAIDFGGFSTRTGGLLSGRIYRAQIYNGIAGTLVFDANFSLAAKLAGSFTESSSNAATVTVNTVGATGARICGERDLYQGTVANQPVITTGARPYITFDGSNDYLRAAPFALIQPESVFFVGNQVSWTSSDALIDGNSNATLQLYQNNASPGVNMNAGSPVVGLRDDSWAVGVNAVKTVVFNGASSQNRLNRGAALTGNPGSGNANGFTLGSRSDGAVPANIAVSEVAIYSSAQNAVTRSQVINYEMAKWGIA